MQARPPHSRYLTLAYPTARVLTELRRDTAADTSRTQSETDGGCTFNPARRSCLGHRRFQNVRAQQTSFHDFRAQNFGNLNDYCTYIEEKRVVRLQLRMQGLTAPG